MTSWRDSATQQAQDDLDELLNSSLPFAEQMLEEHGEFYPYAVAVTASGETTVVMSDPDDGEHPKSTDVLQILAKGLQSDREGLRAVAMVSDVRLTNTDAVRVEVEHREAHAFVVYLPYGKKRLRRGIEYGELSAGPADRQIWPSK